MQHHDRDQVPNVQRRSGAVIADVTDDLLLRGERIKARHVRNLVDVAALGQNAQEIGLVVAHFQGSITRLAASGPVV
jgi:hypothetical protein